VSQARTECIHFDFSGCSLEESLAEVSYFHWSTRDRLTYEACQLGVDLRLNQVSKCIDEYLDAE
jgi:hypothetical protein